MGKIKKFFASLAAFAVTVTTTALPQLPSVTAFADDPTEEIILNQKIDFLGENVFGIDGRFYPEDGIPVNILAEHGISVKFSTASLPPDAQLSIQGFSRFSENDAPMLFETEPKEINKADGVNTIFFNDLTDPDHTHFKKYENSDYDNAIDDTFADAVTAERTICKLVVLFSRSGGEVFESGSGLTLFDAPTLSGSGTLTVSGPHFDSWEIPLDRSEDELNVGELHPIYRDFPTSESFFSQYKTIKVTGIKFENNTVPSDLMTKLVIGIEEDKAIEFGGFKTAVIDDAGALTLDISQGITKMSGSWDDIKKMPVTDIAIKLGTPDTGVKVFFSNPASGETEFVRTSPQTLGVGDVSATTYTFDTFTLGLNQTALWTNTEGLTFKEFMTKYEKVEFECVVSDVLTPVEFDWWDDANEKIVQKSLPKLELEFNLSLEFGDNTDNYDITDNRVTISKDGQYKFTFNLKNKVHTMLSILNRKDFFLRFQPHATEEWRKNNLFPLGITDPWDRISDCYKKNHNLTMCKVYPAIKGATGDYAASAVTSDKDSVLSLVSDSGAVNASDVSLSVNDKATAIEGAVSGGSSLESRLRAEINSNAGNFKFSSDTTGSAATETIEQILNIALSSTKNGQVQPKSGSKVKVYLPLIKLGPKYSSDDLKDPKKQKDIKDKLRIRHFVGETGQEKLVLVDIYYDWDLGCAYFYTDHFSYFMVSDETAPVTHDLASSYTYTDEGHYKKCDVEGCKIKHELEPHTTRVETIDPTETTAGSRTTTCTVCGYTKTEAIPATGVGGGNPNNNNNNNNNNSYTGNGTASTGTGSSSGSGSSDPVTSDGKSGWNSIASAIKKADEGSVIKIDLNGSNTVPTNVLKNLKGKDVTVEFKVNGVYTWAINGKNITSDEKPLTLAIGQATVKQELLSADGIKGSKLIKTFKLSGIPFGCKPELKAAFGKGYKDMFANLYKLDPETGKLVFAGVAKIDKNGEVILPVDADGTYVVVIDAETKLLGDLDNSMGLGAKDALELLKEVVGKTPTKTGLYKSDVNGDGKETPKDALFVLKKITGKA